MANYFKKTEFLYEATVERVIDGDTVVLNIDLGFGLESKNQVFRLHKVYALETTLRWGQTEDEKKLGIKAKEKVQELLPVGAKILVYTHRNRKEKYGRYLAHIYTEELGEESLNDHLLNMGSPMFLNYESHIQMMENRRKEL